MSILTYDFKNTFVDNFGLNITFLTDQINDYNFSLPTLSSISHVGNNVEISFTNTLTSAETDLINTIVSNHDPRKFFIPRLLLRIIETNLNIENFSETNYTYIGSLIFYGPPYMNNIHDIFFVAYMDDTGTSYDLKVFDKMSNLLICEENFNNTGEDIKKFTNLQNLPTSKTQIELHAKVNGTTLLDVKNFSFFYN